MNEKSFGEILKLLFDISGEKCAALAQSLKYDTTYLSKWLSGARLPAAKNRAELVPKLCSFFLAHASADTLSNYADALALQVQPWEISDLRSLLQEHLSAILRRALDVGQPVGVLSELPNSMLLLDRDAANILVEDTIRQYCKNAPEEDIYFITTHSPSRYLIKESIDELSKKTYSIYANKTLNFSQLLECSDIGSAAEYCKIILLHIHHSIRVRYRLYVGKCSSSVRVMVIQNCVCSIEFYDTMLDRVYRCVTKAPEIVNDVFARYQGFLDAGTLVFEQCSLAALSQKHYFSNFVMRDQFSCLMETMQPFLPADVMSRYPAMQDIPDDIRIFWRMLSNPQLHGTIRMIIYKSALMDYILYGKAGIFGQRITVAAPDRITYLQSLIDALNAHKGFAMCLLEDRNTMLSHSNIDCSLYLNGSTMFAVKEDATCDEMGCYLFYDAGTIASFERFYNQLWTDCTTHAPADFSVIHFLQRGIAMIENM
ncbi:MAG: hypothetical protein RRY96_08110 [Ruthenibacterium sp.]